MIRILDDERDFTALRGWKTHLVTAAKFVRRVGNSTVFPPILSQRDSRSCPPPKKVHSLVLQSLSNRFAPPRMMMRGANGSVSGLPVQLGGDGRINHGGGSYYAASTSVPSPPVLVGAKRRRSRGRIAMCLGVACVLLLILGVTVLAAGGPIIRHFVRTQLPLDDPTKLVFKVWADSAYDGISVKRYIYVYSVTNVDAIFATHAKPDLMRKGPYVFRERQWAPYEDIYYAPDGTVGFKYHDTLTFLPEESVDANGNQLSLSDEIVAINLPFFALMHRLKMYPEKGFRTLSCLVIDGLLTQLGPKGVFVQRNVSDLLFGYVDPIFQEFHNLGKDLKNPYLIPTRFRFMWNGSLAAPSPIDYGLGQRCPVWDDQSECNQTAVNSSRVWSGAGWGKPNPIDPEATSAEIEDNDREGYGVPHGIGLLGSHAHWAGNSEMWWWGDKQTYGGDCREFAGGAGMMYPPNMGTKDRPYVFVDSAYRKIRLMYDKDTSVKGVPALRFVIDRDELGFSANSGCYFQEYTGTFNVSNAVFAPLIVSGNGYVDFDTTQPLRRPAFTYPNDQRRALNITIDGRDPADIASSEYDDLRTYLDIYGDAGMLIRGAARLQSNTWLQYPVLDGCEGSFASMLPKNLTGGDGKPYLSYFPETLVPIFYESREALLSDKVADYIKDHVLVFYTVATAVGGTLTALAILLGIAGAVLWTANSRKHPVMAEVFNPDQPQQPAVGASSSVNYHNGSNGNGNGHGNGRLTNNEAGALQHRSSQNASFVSFGLDKQRAAM